MEFLNVTFTFLYWS